MLCSFAELVAPLAACAQGPEGHCNLRQYLLDRLQWPAAYLLGDALCRVVPQEVGAACSHAKLDLSLTHMRYHRFIQTYRV
jgi:hypothetical protein